MFQGKTMKTRVAYSSEISEPENSPSVNKGKC